MSRYAELRALAERARASHPGQWGGVLIANPSYQREWFIAAASPDVILALLDERERLLNELRDRGRTAHYANPIHDPMLTFEECPRSTCKATRAFLDVGPLPSFGQQIAAKGGQLSKADEAQIASGG